MVRPGTPVWMYSRIYSTLNNRFGSTFRAYEDKIEYIQTVITQDSSGTYRSGPTLYLKPDKCYCEGWCDNDHENMAHVGYNCWLTEQECKDAMNMEAEKLSLEHKNAHPNCSEFPCKWECRSGWDQIWYRYDREANMAYIALPDPTGRNTDDFIIETCKRLYKSGDYNFEVP